MNVTVLRSETHQAIIEVDLGRRKSLLINVDREDDPDQPQNVTKPIARVQVRVKEIGPRGGYRDEPTTIGYAKFDTRKPVERA